MNNPTHQKSSPKQSIRKAIITSLLFLSTPHASDSISIKSIRYQWGATPAVAIIISNQSASHIDSATVRLLIEAKDTIGTHFKQVYRSVDTLPMPVTDAFGVRLDICTHKDSNNYSSPCDNTNDWITSYPWSSTNRITQILSPKKAYHNRDAFAIDIPLLGIPCMFYQQGLSIFKQEKY